MKVSTYLFDPRPAEPLQVTAVCYRPENPPTSGITLILAHATGSHKVSTQFLAEVQVQLTQRALVGDVGAPCRFTLQDFGQY